MEHITTGHILDIYIYILPQGLKQMEDILMVVVGTHFTFLLIAV